MMCMPGIPAIYFHSLFGSENFYEGVKETGRLRSINREKVEINKLISEIKKQKSIIILEPWEFVWFKLS